MRIASRIREVRLEQSLSREDLAAKVGLAESLLASFECGREVPSRETLDRLAEALDVPVHRLFYDDTDSDLTPWLTPRPALQRLADESGRSVPAGEGSLLHPRVLLAAVKILLSSATEGGGRKMGTTHGPTIRSSKPPEGASGDRSRE